MAATTAVAWPTADDYRKADRKLATADNVLDELRAWLGRFSNPDVAPSLRDEAYKPGLDEVALLSIFCGHARLELVALDADLAQIERIRDALILDVEIGDDDGR